MREEKEQGGSDGDGDGDGEWSKTDIGRIITSPPGHKSAAQLVAMQSDAPYEMPQSSRRLNRLQMFRSAGRSEARNRPGQRPGSANSKMRQARDQIDGLLYQMRKEEARKNLPRSGSRRNRVSKNRQDRQDRQPFYVSSKFRRQDLLQPVNWLIISNDVRCYIR